MSLNNPGRERAARHAAQAREYRRLAELLLAQETAPAAAGECCTPPPSSALTP